MVSGKTKDIKFAWERPILKADRAFVSRSGDKSKVHHTSPAAFMLVQCPHLLAFRI